MYGRLLVEHKRQGGCMMEIRVLKYFLTAVREGNITRAAEVLHITQPTLSRQLKQLEEQLGAPLFIRGKRSMTITEEGMILKRRAEEIISLAEKAELEIGSQRQDVSGEIVIGCGITEATQTMGKLIKKFKQKYPKTSFHIRNGNSDFVIENIENGLLDIGFVLAPVRIEKLNVLQLQEKERWGILMPKDSVLAQKEHLEVSDLRGIPLINPSRQQTQDDFCEWFGVGYENLHFSATSELTTTASILVKNEIGYAIVIEGSVHEAMHENLCFRPLYPSLITHSLVVWKKHQTCSLTVSKFLDFIAEEIKNNKAIDDSLV